MTCGKKAHEIDVKTPDTGELEKMDLFDWPIWTKEISTFPWRYEEPETCYFLEGEVTVRAADGSEVRMKKGDLVTFPKGLECTWEVHRPVKKHYRFG